MRKLINWIWLPILLLFLQVDLSAQELGRHLGLGIYGGPQKLVGGNGDAAMLNGINLFYGFSDKLILDANLGAGWTRSRDPNSQFKRNPTPPQKFFRTWLVPLDLNVQYFFKPDGVFRPYLTGGVGILVWQLRYARWKDDLLSPSGANMQGTQYNASGNLGLGTAISLSERFLLDLSGRYHYLYDQTLDNIGTGYDAKQVGSDPYAALKKVRTGDVNDGVLEFRLGIRFLFGGPRDSDGDGIIDRLDKCPNQAEDIDSFEDEDGCPDYDNDQDGIPDVQDQCPNLAEDKDGFQDDDGCPDLDNDNDGISDSQDKCPNQAEDLDNFEDNDGCPDLDNDGDGIADTMDKCPNEPETVNGYQDEDGCPDTPPVVEKPVIEMGKSLIFPGVTFQSGKALLTEEAMQTLQTVYQMLRDNPTVRIEIRGYTDNYGSAAKNLDLSQKRAAAVKQFLVGKGIESNRMVAIGFGQDKPIASNATAAGRAQNRRIEFVRIE